MAGCIVLSRTCRAVSSVWSPLLWRSTSCCAISSASRSPTGSTSSRQLRAIAAVLGHCHRHLPGSAHRVDIVWANVGPRGQRAIDVLATTLVCCSWCPCRPGPCWSRLSAPTPTTCRTSDLRLPFCPFYALAGPATVAVDPDGRTHLPPDLPPRFDARRLSDQADRLRRRRWIAMLVAVIGFIAMFVLMRCACRSAWRWAWSALSASAA